MFDLNVHNTTDGIYEVTSADIFPKRNDTSTVPVKFVDNKTGEPQDPITIMKLGKFQQLNFRLLARKGTGRQHAKWSPVATCIMFKEPVVRIDDEAINKTLTPAQRKEFVGKCPRKVFSYNQLKQQVEIEDSHKCNLCIECYRYAVEENGLEKSVHLGEDDHKFNFKIEGTGALPPVDIMKRAFGILKNKIDCFNKDLMDNISQNIGNMRY